MLLYEIKLPSGFSLDIDANMMQNPEAKRIEFVKGSVNLYYDEVGDV